ncbi:unnamed protein product [Microthlaspi erraticum]|uniref:Uncharacterized protein n=1 Tax=Microthlaspi erraticum TaxID=1685480 RepID=A0A6D2JVP3_9BRAS|nr:unnamed protein product [Microthlaspi erraticum]
MDFIKTSSLRALIELTFQRNWNGLIWMSRKGVIAKRVKTAPDGSIENQRPNAQTGWPRNACSALGQNVRPSEVSAKVKTVRPITHHDPGKARGRPRHDRARHAHTDSLRNLSRTTADVPSEPGNNVPRPAEKPSAKFIRPTTPADREIIRPDRSDSAKDPTVRPTVPTDRPNAAVDPKPFLKPNPHNSSPKPAPT